MERKLSTVFALDVVGYSKLMADDEARTLSNLKMRREFIDSLIEEFGGRIFNTAGDSVMAEFGSIYLTKISKSFHFARKPPAPSTI